MKRSVRAGAVLAVLAAACAAAALAGTGGASATPRPPSLHSGLDHVFVIMLENHSQHSVIDQHDPATGDLVAPYITSLAHRYATASHYYGVTHPSQPNYIAAITGSNWGIQDDNLLSQPLDVPNIVDQLEAHGLTWDAYMDAIDPSNKLAPTAPGSNALYAIKHDPFVLMKDIVENPARMAHVKPYSDFAADLASGNIGNFVWISPDQCNDMHGGIYGTLAGYPETPCPYGDAVNVDAADVALQHKADDFVKRTVEAIMASPAWTGNSAIFVTADENDFDATTPDRRGLGVGGRLLRLAVRAGRRPADQPGLARRRLRRRARAGDPDHDAQQAPVRQRHAVQPLLVPRDGREALAPWLPRERG